MCATPRPMDARRSGEKQARNHNAQRNAPEESYEGPAAGRPAGAQSRRDSRSRHLRFCLRRVARRAGSRRPRSIATLRTRTICARRSRSNAPNGSPRRCAWRPTRRSLMRNTTPFSQADCFSIRLEAQSRIATRDLRHDAFCNEFTGAEHGGVAFVSVPMSVMIKGGVASIRLTGLSVRNCHHRPVHERART